VKINEQAEKTFYFTYKQILCASKIKRMLKLVATLALRKRENLERAEKCQIEYLKAERREIKLKRAG